MCVIIFLEKQNYCKKFMKNADYSRYTFTRLNTLENNQRLITNEKRMKRRRRRRRRKKIECLCIYGFRYRRFPLVSRCMLYISKASIFRIYPGQANFAFVTVINLELDISQPHNAHIYCLFVLNFNFQLLNASQ